MAQEKEIMRDTSVFSLSRFVSFFFIALNGLVIAKVLGPAAFGVFNALMLVVTYSQHSHLGLLTAMTKKVPFYKGKKKNDLAKETKDVTFSGSMIVVSTVCLALVAISFFIKNVSIHTITSLRIVALIIILQQIFYFYQTHLMVEKKFWMIGKMLLIYSITYFILVIGLITEFKLEGVFFSSLMAYGITLIYLIRAEKFKFKLTIRPKKTLQYIKYGFPLLAITLVSVFLISIDKMMILKFMDAVQLGYYSIAILVLELLYFIPGAVGYILFPHLAEKYSEKEDKKYIRNHLFQPTMILSYFMPIMIGLVFLTVPLAIYYALPKYIPGISSVKIIVCAGFFMSVIIVASNFLITLNKEREILYAQAMSILVAVLFNYIFISRGFGIKGVAIATAITYLFYSTVIFVYSFRHYIHKIKCLIKFFITICAPFLYALLVLALLNIIPLSGNMLKDIGITILKLGIFILLMLPLVWLINKKTGVFELALSMALSKFSKKNYDL